MLARIAVTCTLDVRITDYKPTDTILEVQTQAAKIATDQIDAIIRSTDLKRVGDVQVTAIVVDPGAPTPRTRGI